VFASPVVIADSPLGDCIQVLQQNGGVKQIADSYQG
jgi:hypothetical protein